MSKLFRNFASQMQNKRKDVIMLKEEFQFYLDHQNELLQQYKGKFVVIVGNSVVGAYRSFKDAVLRSAKKYELGTFLVQECTEGDEAYTDHFYNSNVIFA